MFQNRKEAGMLLADKLSDYKKSNNTIVLAIPRGGVVVGRQIADKLNLPFSVIVVKKLGAPGNVELAIGAIAPDGIKFVDWELALKSGVEQDYLNEELKNKQKEVDERLEKFGIRKQELIIRNQKIIILVDDGIATGATTLAALKYINHLKLTTHNLQLTTILAVPVIAKDTFDKLKSDVDQIVALEVSGSFNAVGQFYQEFPQVDDEEVIKLL